MSRQLWSKFSDAELRLLQLALSVQSTDDDMSETEDEICNRLHHDVRNELHDRLCRTGVHEGKLGSANRKAEPR